MSQAATQSDSGGHEASQEPQEHGGHGNMVGTYISIFLVLSFLTVLEVFVPTVYSSEWNSTLKMILLCILAFAKAILVASYFMHLKWELAWVKWIAALPIYMGIFVIVIMLETAYR